MYAFSIYFLIFFANSLVQCDEQVKEMVGLQTKHDVQINKDTIINQNMNLEQKPKKNAHEKDEPEPDWTYNPVPEEVASHVLKFKQNMTECLKEIQASDKRPVKRLSPKQESPVHGECLIACVFRRNEVILNGKIHKENLISLVGKFYAKNTKVMKKLEKNVDRCIQAATSSQDMKRDECALAARLNECTNDLMSNNKNKIEIDY